MTVGSLWASFKRTLLAIGLISGVINLLTLTGSFFMLRVYDRVMPSRSVPTLVALAGMAALLYAFQGTLELIRSRILVRVGLGLDARLNAKIHAALTRLPLRTKVPGDGLQPLRDLDQVRTFLSGGGPAAFYDLPWVPLYIGICFLFHVYIGAIALGGAFLLLALTLLAEVRNREPAKKASAYLAARNSLAEAGRRNAEVLHTIGFGNHIGARWEEINADYLAAGAAASDTAGSLGTVSKILRMTLQSGILATGAWLIIHQEATGGITLASSITSGRALSPIDVVIAQWKNFVAAWQGRARLAQVLAALPKSATGVQLPAPAARLSLEAVTLAPPGLHRTVVSDVSFSLPAGAGLGIIGPSASGKSSLARAIAGVWTPLRGSVRLDGATLDQWAPEELGAYLGYLPQDV